MLVNVEVLPTLRVLAHLVPSPAVKLLLYHIILLNLIIIFRNLAFFTHYS